ncbi:hypothetical protein [Ectobacillus ponti]|uniref:Uncharacterized protein n=1 Tax=Ectobacillus ponti TaxID=2961894 RepID=A0AA41XCH5_9BACI|nr:hypothetical protein [Ectobacillus ponti]MCP8969541.1 hypothetical protein [Ectobacillus ponti]
MEERFVDNRYLTDMLSMVLSFDNESIQNLSAELQSEVYQSLQNVKLEFDKLI